MHILFITAFIVESQIKDKYLKFKIDIKYIDIICFNKTDNKHGIFYYYIYYNFKIIQYIKDYLLIMFTLFHLEFNIFIKIFYHFYKFLFKISDLNQNSMKLIIFFKNFHYIHYIIFSSIV